MSAWDRRTFQLLIYNLILASIAAAVLFCLTCVAATIYHDAFWVNFFYVSFLVATFLVYYTWQNITQLLDRQILAVLTIGDKRVITTR